MTIIINVPTFQQVVDSLNDAELGLGKLFAHCFRDSVIYEPIAKKTKSKEGAGTWYLYDSYWKEDESGQIYNLIANQFANQFAQAAAVEIQNNPQSELAGDLWQMCTRLKTKSADDKTLFWANKQAGMFINPLRWDSDPYLLGCVNGIIDLRTGELRAARPGDYIRSIVPIPFLSLNTPAPRWEQFLSEVFDGDSELVGFMQRLLGYSISGLTIEHIFPILCGQGRNGKTLMIETINHILGHSLSGPVAAEILLDASKNPNAASPHLCDLIHRRLSFVAESNEGWLNSATVKALTGGDTLVARPLYGDVIRFKPKHKIYLVTNKRPRADADDYALWQRVKVIEFLVSFVDDPKMGNERKADKQLGEKLKAESSGILSWLVRGFLAWQSEGLNPPQSVKLAVEEYRQGEDSILRFINDTCELGSDKEIKAGILYSYYTDWTKDNGIRPLGSVKFSQKIAHRFEKEVRSDATYYLGIDAKMYFLDIDTETHKINREAKEELKQQELAFKQSGIK